MLFAIALLFRPNPRTSVAQTVYVEFFPPFQSTTRNYIPFPSPEEFDIPLPEPSVLSRLTKALEFRRKGIPVVIRRKSEGNGRVEEERLGSVEVSRERPIETRFRVEKDPPVRLARCPKAG